jgi:ATP-dependent protease ClpP protease subunit
MALQPITYATFVGIISQESAARVIFNVNMMSQNGVRDLHVLFQSLGGATGDGVALFNYFRTCPINLHFYNAGTIESAGVTAFVGAPYASGVGRLFVRARA